MKYLSHISILRNVALRFILIFAFAAIFEACTDEKRDECFTDLSLRFTYTHNEHEVDLLDSQVQSLDLYFYDYQNRLIEHRRVARTELQARNTFSLRHLPLDDYTVVAWGNYNTAYYSCNDAYRLSDMKMNLLADNDGGLSENPCHIFHGIAHVSWGAKGEQEISLTKTTNNIHIEIVNRTTRSITRSIGPFAVKMTGIYGSYNYENNSTGFGLLYYIPDCVAITNGYKADFTVTRLRENDGLRVEIKDENDIILHDDLITNRILSEYPLVNNNSDLDKFDDYTLIYEVSLSNDGDYTFTLIQINDWDLTNSTGGI